MNQPFSVAATDFDVRDVEIRLWDTAANGGGIYMVVANNSGNDVVTDVWIPRDEAAAMIGYLRAILDDTDRPGGWTD